jgi:hypothetical protein
MIQTSSAGASQAEGSLVSAGGAAHLFAGLPQPGWRWRRHRPRPACLDRVGPVACPLADDWLATGYRRAAELIDADAAAVAEMQPCGWRPAGERAARPRVDRTSCTYASPPTGERP